ncbi:MAG TPA: sugar phosphate nucleotidyltransferase [bacterium]|nr:sugar phosphate nucleotidyltransferase [bacterium]HOL67906.1 sugar phosphate nucleotidyltransferase [bacterium]
MRCSARVRKAVIPAAGFSPHLFPATKVIKKELFPVVDRSGRAKPVIMFIIEEALAAGIEEVCVIVQKNDRPLFEEFFGTPPTIENFNKLSDESKEYLQYLLNLGRRVTIISQDVQEGFGHAVCCSQPWVNQEPFLLLLGDHLYTSATEVPCAKQILQVYERFGCNVVGLKITSGQEVHQYGCVTGTWRHPGSILDITSFYEKPRPDYARQHLRVEGLPEDSYLTIFGLYVLKPKIFQFLEENIRRNIREHGEFQLTSCLDRLRQEDDFIGYLVQGQRFDIGTPGAFRETIINFPLAQKERSDEATG